MQLDPVIGLEVHVQLLTWSKMFCSCPADYSGADPNTHVCPVCLGMPGVLPAINKKAVEYTIMTGLALHCTIAMQTKFDRKNYPYPDLMKGYQITQYDMPLTYNGWLELEGGKRAGITRVHLEEDTARLLHRMDPTAGEGYSLVDVNRSGVPLMEVVGDPDLSSPEEARQYLVKLRTILRYLGVSTGNMEEGSFRCDANVSLKADGVISSTRVEVKNMNSFRSVYRALQHEAERQAHVLGQGGRVIQETRGWDEDRGVTVPQRTKEYAHDYRYFPEPDLPPLVVSPAWAEEVRSRLPELPDDRRERFQREFALSFYDASLLTTSRATADFFEETVSLSAVREGKRIAQAKAAANWMTTELARLLNAAGKELEESPLSPRAVSEMLDLVDNGTLSSKMAKDVFEVMFRTGKDAAQVVREQGLVQISDEEELGNIVAAVVAQNPRAVEDYQSGKEQALKFLVGQVMQATRGQANPQKSTELMTQRLSGGS